MDRPETSSEQLHLDISNGVQKIPIFTPNQVFLGSLLGGPFAGIYILGTNFKAMGKDRKARMLWLLGPLLVLSFFVIDFAWPTLPLQALPVSFALIACWISITRQMNKPEILASTTHESESNWRVAAVAFLGFIASVVLLYLGAFIYLNLHGS